MYTDDLNMACHSERSELSICEGLIDSNLDRISKFSRKGLLYLSHESFYFPIGKFPILNMSLNGRIMTSKKSVRDLCLLYASSLNFCESVALNLFKAHWLIGLITGIFHSL